MSFYKKYELDRLIADGEAKTFRAVENSTGRPVFLHLFNPSGQALLASLRAKLGDEKGKPIAPLIEIGEFAGNPYAVTEAIEPFRSLRDWISANVTASNPLLKEDSSPSLAVAGEVALPKPAAPPAGHDWLSEGSGEIARTLNPAPVQAPLPASPPATGLVAEVSGEFARILRPSQSTPPARPPAAGLVAEEPGDFARILKPSQPAPPARPPAAGLVAEEPGEFTRLFEPSQPAPPARPPAAGLVAEEPGEFTRLFEPSQPAPPARPPAAGLVAEEPGEFTRLFEPSQPAPPARPSIAGPVAQSPGEFARRFEPSQPAPPARPPAVAPTAQEPSEFTQLFEPSQPTPPARPSATGPVAQGPGEFARRFEPSQLPQASREPSQQRPETAPPPRPPKPSPESGEFTSLFGSRLPGEAIDIEKEHASASLSAPPESRPFQAAGEFTRMFGPEGVKGASTPANAGPPPSLNTSSKISASGMFGDPDELARFAAETLAAGRSTDGDPGEYTRMFDGPKSPHERPVPAPPKAPLPEAVPPKKSNRDLIVIAIALMVLVALIVLAIALRK